MPPRGSGSGHLGSPFSRRARAHLLGSQRRGVRWSQEPAAVLGAARGLRAPRGREHRPTDGLCAGGSRLGGSVSRAPRLSKGCLCVTESPCAPFLPSSLAPLPSRSPLVFRGFPGARTPCQGLGTKWARRCLRPYRAPGWGGGRTGRGGRAGREPGPAGTGVGAGQRTRGSVTLRTPRLAAKPIRWSPARVCSGQGWAGGVSCPSVRKR